MSREANSRENAGVAPWLTIVGIGADGVEGLPRRSREAIERAELVVGGARQLSLVQALVRADTLAWPSPFTEGVERLLARRGRPTCLLASGDPFFFGVGATLAAHLSRGEFVCYPAPSSVSLAAARLGWALQDTDIVSLHGRDLHALVRFLVPGRRVIALSWDGETPFRVAELLVARGFEASTLHVLEALERADERVQTLAPDELARGARPQPFDPLNLMALELRAPASCHALASRLSLPDDAFEHDGQLTKQDVRAVTLSALAPRPGALLWDVGAGAGSIAIEWMRSHPACRAVAVERDRGRCERIARNARNLGVPTLRVVHAEAPAGLEGLERPDAVFVGGGGGDRSLFERCWQALASGGRLVINAVSLETEAVLLALYAQHGGELRRISIETAARLGGMTGFRPGMPIVQWRIDKP